MEMLKVFITIRKQTTALPSGFCAVKLLLGLESMSALQIYAGDRFLEYKTLIGQTMLIIVSAQVRWPLAKVSIKRGSTVTV